MRVRLIVYIAVLIALSACRAPWQAADPNPAASASPTSNSPATACAPRSASASAGVRSAAVVAGNRANSKLASLPVLSCYLDPVLDRPAHVVVAVSDGKPFAAFDARLADLPEGRRRTDAKRTFVRELSTALETPARTAEADPLEAIGLVVGALRSDAAGPRLVVINDDLLQTTGALPFQRGYLYGDPADLVEDLKPYLGRTLRDLHGYRFVLLASGATRAPQSATTTENRYRLVALWSTLLRARGAKVVVDTGTVFTDPTATGLPTVTPVDLRPPSRPPVRPRGPAAACTQTVTAAEIGFVSDAARFVDQAAAQQTIDRVADRLAGCEGRIELIGTTSSAGTEAGRRRVSLARAKAVRTLLAEALGVKQSTIAARGVGMHFAAYVDDRRPDGSLDAVKAQCNRLVVIRIQR